MISLKPIRQVNVEEESFNILFYNNPQPMWIFEVVTLKFLEVNNSAIRLYGYSQAEFLQMTVRELRPKEDLEKFELAIASLDGPSTHRKEFRHFTKDGRLRNVQIVSYPLNYYGANARLVQVYDITDLREYERKLTDAFDKINQTLESINDGFFILDREWKVTYWNKAAEDLTGVKREQILNHIIWNVFPQAKDMSFYDRYTSCMANQETLRFEEYFPPLKMWFSITAYPAAEGVMIYFHDTTEKKEREKEIDEKNEKLLEIAYINSHILRRPLANILGIIETIEEDEPDNCVSEALILLKKSATELDRIIKQINLRTVN